MVFESAARYGLYIMTGVFIAGESIWIPWEGLSLFCIQEMPQGQSSSRRLGRTDYNVV